LDLQHKRSFKTGARERIEQDQSESIPVLMMMNKRVWGTSGMKLICMRIQVLGKKPIPVSLYPLNKHALAWNRMQVFTAQGQQLTAGAKAWSLAWSFIYL